MDVSVHPESLARTVLTSGTTIEALALALKPKGTLNAVTPILGAPVILYIILRCK